MSRPTVALAMSAKMVAGGGTDDDRLVKDLFTERGLDAIPTAWDSATQWHDCAAVLLRSCWDYHRRPGEFRAWLDRLEDSDVPVANPVDLVRWNVDKRYLRDLTDLGVPVVPTLWRDRLEDRELADLRAELAADDLLVKPAIGATARACSRIAADSRLAAPLVPPHSTGPWLVQPFLTEVLSDGEWSLIWLAGQFSHAVLKRSKPGDFRVQTEWGGTAERRTAGADLLEVAERAIAGLEPDPLYARVDLIRTASGPRLMELELIEPELFLQREDPCLGQLVEAVAKMAIDHHSRRHDPTVG